MAEESFNREELTEFMETVGEASAQCVASFANKLRKDLGRSVLSDADFAEIVKAWVAANPISIGRIK